MWRHIVMSSDDIVTTAVYRLYYSWRPEMISTGDAVSVNNKL